MEDRLLQLGVGGVVVFLVIMLWKTVAPKHNGQAGERSVEFWEALHRKIVKEEVKELNEQVMGTLQEMRRDTERIRVLSHDLIVAIGHNRTAIEALTQRLDRERDMRRRGRVGDDR